MAFRLQPKTRARTRLNFTDAQIKALDDLGESCSWLLLRLSPQAKLEFVARTRITMARTLPQAPGQTLLLHVQQYPSNSGICPVDSMLWHMLSVCYSPAHPGARRNACHVWAQDRVAKYFDNYTQQNLA